MSKIVKKIVYEIEIKLDSPVCVAVSEFDSEWTDADIIKDFDGNPFIPGSSLAGAMREYLEHNKGLDNTVTIFGSSKEVCPNPESKMSPLFVSDLLFDKEYNIGVREQVSLTEEKIAESECLFNMEEVDTGAKGRFIMELTVREKDNEDVWKNQIMMALKGMHFHEVRLGAKKTRGYGLLHIENIYKKEFDSSNIMEYAKVYTSDKLSGFEQVKISNWKEEQFGTDNVNYDTIELPLKLRGGISIRRYAAKKNEPDFEHVTVMIKDTKKMKTTQKMKVIPEPVPVIPGTSIAGAVRSRIREILDITDLKTEEKKEILDQMFGYVRKKTEKDNKTEAKRSPIMFEECIIEGAKPMIVTRNAISRFEAATKDGALFQEKMYVDGEFVLRIKVQRQEREEHKQWIGLLLLALKDLQNGYLAIGGQTAVGRGLFEPVSDIPLKINGKEAEESLYNVCIRNYCEKGAM